MNRVSGLYSIPKVEIKALGASSKVYGAAYRFFEQKLILERLPKSRNRLIQEKRWGCNITEWAPNGGYDRKSQKILPMGLFRDEYGEVYMDYVDIDIDDERDKYLERQKKEQERKKKEQQQNNDDDVVVVDDDGAIVIE